MRTSGAHAEQHENRQATRGAAAARQETSGSPAVPPPLTAAALRAAQRGAGNAAVTAMIARRARPAPVVEQQDPGVHEVLRSVGKPLSAPVRRDMESRFRTDFSDVRLHTGAAAARSAQAIGARAYTSGSDVVIGDGGGDKHTLAHELTHVVQQRQGPVAGTDNGSALKISDPSDRFERAAEANARRVMSGPAPPHHDVGPAEVATLQSAAGNQAATASVQRAGEDVIEAEAPTRESTPPADEAALEVSTDPDAVMVRLTASIEAHTLQTKRKFNFWEPHKKWPEDWLLENTRIQWVLERRLVLGKAFQQDELRDIEILSAKRPRWLNSVGIGTLEEARRIAAGRGGTADAGRTASGKGKEKAGKDAQDEAAEQEHADYSTWLKLSPGRRILAATLAFQTQAPAPGASTPNNPAYTLGRFMRTNELGPDDPERETLENERNEQIRQTAVDTLFPDGLREEQKHESAGDHATEEMQGRDAFARDILTNVLLILRHGLQVAGKDDNYVDYKEGDVIRALAHGGRVNIRIPALRKGESPQQLLDFLGVTDNGTLHKYMLERDYATHRSSIGKNKDGEPGSFKEEGGVGAAVKNKVSEVTPGMTTPDLLALNVSGGGFGTKDWNGDVILPDGSYGHLLLVFTAPTGDRDGALLVGLETVAPGARSPVGYHHGVRSTEATANPESVLHGHKQDKIGATRAELGKMGKGDWHGFLQTIKQDWVGKLQAAKDTAQKRKLYEELVGPRA
ncbi:DUF4157 domain-containing protein [Streptomyces acidicola]|uniref:eCIS core domain-containing protein n=1 Tax=Streptomyces acidicola TaxID=2596892 RepID=UPI003799A416